MHYRHHKPDTWHHWGKSAAVTCRGCSTLCSLMSMAPKLDVVARLFSPATPHIQESIL